MPEQYYIGKAYVFWTHTTANRDSFELDERFHRTFRELLCHASTRYNLIVPVYCLMPDHIHLIWIGLSPESNQLNATQFLRRACRDLIRPAGWQRQPYDHVLTEHERRRNVFAHTMNYILMNPVRSALVEGWFEYPYLGTLIPGYPDLNLRDDKFTARFWRIKALVEGKFDNV